MTLRYDFDMVTVTPDGLPDQFGDLALTGVAAEKTAMFRDPKAAEALRAADPAVRMFFQESGFGLQDFDSGAPPGHYVASDESHRIRVIERLTANLGTHDLTGANWGAFDFQAFLGGLDVATPLEDETLLAPTLARPSQETQSPTPTKRSSRRGIALVGLMFGIVLLCIAAVLAIS